MSRSAREGIMDEPATNGVVGADVKRDSRTRRRVSSSRSASLSLERRSAKRSKQEEILGAASLITDEDHTKIIKTIKKFRLKPEFTLRIPNVEVKKDKVTISYLVKYHNDKETDQSSDESEEELFSEAPTKIGRLLELEKQLEKKYLKSVNRSISKNDPSPEDVERDVLRVRDAVRNIIPNVSSESICMTELKLMPRFVPTIGSALNKCNDLHIAHVNGIGVITALLRGQTTTTDFALTVGHGLDRGDDVCITRNNNHQRIGTVQEVIVNNDDDEYVESALIRLLPNAIEALGLKNHFLIENVPHSLWVSNIEAAEEGRVVLRAVDQDAGDVKGLISCVGFNILEDLQIDKKKCILISRYNGDLDYRGIIHEPGESGLLCTYGSNPSDHGNRVKPVAMLIGYYEGCDSTGRYTCSSVGVDLRRVLARLECSTNVAERLQISHIAT